MANDYPDTGTAVSGTDDGSGPQVTMTDPGSSNVALLQVASGDGSGALKSGLMVFELYHPGGEGGSAGAEATIAVT